MIGEMLGSYRILDKIGEGGMGEVYRARDTHLERDVAIKVLPETWATDADRLARFKREAQLLASLNHPHIAQIYGVETAAAPPGAPVSTTALVMELVEGPTLADRIAAAPLPVADAIAIARQIVDALDAAHEHGIIHRDLKPANVKVREDGTVKLLDFGLAKAVAPGNGARPGVSMPTITSPAMTAMGIVLGTAAYMSPEQARGRAVDKRTDVWAFGCVLFEMLSGRRPFDGEDVTEVLAAVVKSEPAWEHLPASVPPALVRLLERCLEKDVRLRLRDIGDAPIDLTDVTPAPMAPSDAGSRRSGRERLVWLAALVLFAGIAASARWGRSPSIGGTLTRFPFVLPEGQRIGGPIRRLAVSPDGTVIVYAANNRLYRRALSQMEPQPIAGPENATLPVFSPDGRSIAYVGPDPAGQGYVISSVPTTGGTPVKVGNIGDASSRGGWNVGDASLSWNGDDIIVSNEAGVSAISLATGARRVLVPLDPAIEVASGAQLVDGGKQVLYTLRRVAETGPDASSIVVQTVGGTTRRPLVRAARLGIAVATGQLVYLRGTDLMASALDVRRMEVTGDPIVIATGVTVHWAVSNTGTIAYQVAASVSPRNLVWVDRHGKEDPIPMPPQPAALLRLSPDGRRLALGSDREIDVWSFEKSTITRISEAGGGHWDAVWTKDSHRLLFSSGVPTTGVRILSKVIDGAGAATVLTEAPDGGFPNALSPDGKFLLFHRGANQLMIQPLDPPGTPQELTKGIALNAVFSPDGQWIAYQSVDAALPEIFVRSFLNTEAGPRPVASGGGKYPLWSPDGRELFFIDNAGWFTSVGVETRDGFATGLPVRLFSTRAYALESNSRPFDISRDGRFVFMKSSGDASSFINVVTNWHGESVAAK